MIQTARKAQISDESHWTPRNQSTFVLDKVIKKPKGSLACTWTRSKCLMEQRSKCNHTFSEDLDPKYNRKDPVCIHDPVWVWKWRREPLFYEPPNGRITIFDKDQAMKYYLYWDDSLDKATKLKTFKLESLRWLAENNEKLLKE